MKNIVRCWMVLLVSLSLLLPSFAAAQVSIDPGARGVAAQAQQRAVALDTLINGNTLYVTLTPASSTSDVTGSASPIAIAARIANTAAINTAIATVKARLALSGTAGRAANKLRIQLPAGVFALNTNTNFLIDFPGLEVVGAGQYSTTLLVQSNTAVFDMGAPSTNPADTFPNTAQGYRFADFAIINPQYYSITQHGTRSGSAIRDNGSGTGVLDRLLIGGFKYCINQVFGSDFMTGRDSKIELCDTAHYVGPGSFQDNFDNFVYYQNYEDVVIDRAGDPTWIRPVFLNTAKNSITLEGFPGNLTRQLTGFNAAGIGYQSNIAFIKAWFESNAGSAGVNTIPDNFVYTNNTGSDAYRNVNFLQPIVVAGQVNGVRLVSAFSHSVTGGLATQNMTVDGMVFQGNMSFVFRQAGNRSVLRNFRTDSGSVAPTLSSSNNLVVENTTESWTRTAGALPDSRIDLKRGLNDLTAGVRESIPSNGVLAWGYATAADTWSNTLGLDASKGRFVFGDPSVSSNPGLRSAAAMPTSGTYAKGEFIFNSAPTVAGGKLLVGWTRLTTGSGNVAGTDWSPIYGTISYNFELHRLPANDNARQEQAA